MRVLQKNMSGNDIRYLQWFLGIPVTGFFDAATVQAVKTKQKATGLKDDGSVGPATQLKWGLTDYIVHIYDPKDIWFAGDAYEKPTHPLRTLKEWAELEGADRVYNLSLFEMKTGRTVNYLKASGNDVGYGGVPQRMSVNPGNICGGYKVPILFGETQTVSSVGARSRNANGLLKDGRYFQIQSIYNVTEKAIRDFMAKNYKVGIMLMQDGGGSTGFYDRTKNALIAPEKEGQNGRPVASVVCVKLASYQQIKICPLCGQEVTK